MPSCQVEVSSGDILCIYTDGVTESAEENGEEFFGAQRIEAAVRSRFDADLPDMLDEVARKTLQFTAENDLVVIMNSN